MWYVLRGVEVLFRCGWQGVELAGKQQRGRATKVEEPEAGKRDRHAGKGGVGRRQSTNIQTDHFRTAKGEWLRGQ